MTRLDENQQTRITSQQNGQSDQDWFDVAVLVEHQVTGTSARRMLELYQMKNTPLRYNLVRPLNGDTPDHADQLLRKSLERLEALQVNANGVVSELPAVDALTDLVGATGSSEVVVVTDRHRLATLLRRDLASQARSQVDLPLVHLVNR